MLCAELDLLGTVCYHPCLMIGKSSAVNPYVELMYTDFKDWAYDTRASGFRGLWRSEVFDCASKIPLDIEIGTGNGTHFAHRAQQSPARCIVGLELKFKTLVQSIRRARSLGCQNARMVRYKAESVVELFAPSEVNDVFIYFPDPWPKLKQQKNRLIQKKFLEDLFLVMQQGSYLDFKTDDWRYFRWATKQFFESPFEVLFYSEDLHSSFRKEKNFVTQFESLFIKKRQPTYYCRLQKQDY